MRVPQPSDRTAHLVCTRYVGTEDYGMLCYVRIGLCIRDVFVAHQFYHDICCAPGRVVSKLIGLAKMYD